MTVKYIPGDFGPEHFPKDFGFSGSNEGARIDAGDTDGDGTYVGKQKALKRSTGGGVPGVQKAQKAAADGDSAPVMGPPMSARPGSGAGEGTGQNEAPITAMMAKHYSKRMPDGSAKEIDGPDLPESVKTVPISEQEFNKGEGGYRRGGAIKRADGGTITDGTKVGGDQDKKTAAAQAWFNRVGQGNSSDDNPPPLRRASGGGIDLETVPGRPGNAPIGKGSPTGGALQNATVAMPLGTAAKTIAAAVELGKTIGEHNAVAGRPIPAPDQSPVPAMKHGGHLTAADRRALPSKDFALPGGRYPIEDASHARNALSRVSQNGNSEEKATVRRAVHRKYPGIGQQ